MPGNGRRIVFYFSLFALLASCGGGSDIAKLVGPILSLDDLPELRIDQLYIGAVAKDEFGTPRFAVYLRDAATEKAVACAGGSDGLKVIREPGIFYGRLDIPLQISKGLDTYEGLQFQLVIVEKDSDDCPQPIQADDEIIGITPTVNFAGLLNTLLTTTNGQARVLLKVRGADSPSVPLMVASLTPRLGVEALTVPEAIDPNGPVPLYSLVLLGSEGDGFGCQIGSDQLPTITAATPTYGGLNLFFPCGSLLSDADLAHTMQIQLWRQIGDETDQVTQTRYAKLKELVGETVPFEDEHGSIRLRDWNPTAFSRPKLAQEEMALLQVAELTTTVTPAEGGALEVHLVEDPLGYSVACSPSRGDFTATSGQEDLFGWPAVSVALVERAAGAACPDLLAAGDTVRAKTIGLAPEALLGGSVNLTGGDGKFVGRVTLSLRE